MTPTVYSIATETTFAVHSLTRFRKTCMKLIEDGTRFAVIKDGKFIAYYDDGFFYYIYNSVNKSSFSFLPYSVKYAIPSKSFRVPFKVFNGISEF